MKHNRYPRLVVDDQRRESLTSSSGALLLRDAAQVAGLDEALSAALAPWTSPRATHDPGLMLLDLAIALALGGDCAADVAIVRAQPDLFGPVASDATFSRLISVLADDLSTALPAIRAARAAARTRVWTRARPLAGTPGTRDGGQVIVDLDATTIGAHSLKEHAQLTYKRQFGHSPMCAFVDHGQYGTGEPLIIDLRRGGASPQGADLHINTTTAALAQLPAAERPQVLLRTDAGGCSKKFLRFLRAEKLAYSIGFTLYDNVKTAIAALPEQAWRDAFNGDEQPRNGAQVAELTDLIVPAADPTDPWPAGMRVIVRREYPDPGAQLRLTDIDGRRYTAFATNTRGTGWTLPVLELRHRQRARAEDRIRNLKDTGMANLPFHEFTKNQIWLEIVCLAAELLAWTQTLCWPEHHPARLFEPKRMRLCILAVAGRTIHTGRRHLLRLPRGWPYNDLIYQGYTALHAA